MENTMLLVASLMYHEKKTLQWGPPAGFGPIPSTWLALMLRQDFSQAHVVAHLGLHLETLGNPRSKCRFAGKNTSKWLMFHCHISLPEGRYPARPIVVTFHVSLLSIKKKNVSNPIGNRVSGNIWAIWINKKSWIYIYIYVYNIYISTQKYLVPSCANFETPPVQQKVHLWVTMSRNTFFCHMLSYS